MKWGHIIIRLTTQEHFVVTPLNFMMPFVTGTNTQVTRQQSANINRAGAPNNSLNPTRGWPRRATPTFTIRASKSR